MIAARRNVKGEEIKKITFMFKNTSIMGSKNLQCRFSGK